MPAIKIYPPNQLPEKGVTNLLFDVWTQELEVYIQQDERLAVFLPRGTYSTWLPRDQNPDRLAEARGGDNAAQLAVRRRELGAFLSVVAKACNIQHYNMVTRNSTSLEWIYTKLREDYDIQQKGIHFFNLLDIKYEPSEPAAAFYNRYRNLIMANLGKQGDAIRWLNVEELEEDEKLSPTMEDLILLNVLTLIDPRMPAHIKDHYHHLIGKSKRLMDFKADILVKIPTYLAEIPSAISRTTEPGLHSEGPTISRGASVGAQPPTTPGQIRAEASLYTAVFATSQVSQRRWSNLIAWVILAAPKYRQWTNSSLSQTGTSPESMPYNKWRSPPTLTNSLKCWAMARTTRLISRNRLV